MSEIAAPAEGVNEVEVEERYIAEMETLVDAFHYELCDNCGRDLIDHLVGPDPLGHPHLWCLLEVSDA